METGAYRLQGLEQGTVAVVAEAEPVRAARQAEAPDASPQPCYVVAIGASAGGQAALERFFAAMPANCGLSFVVIMHLPPQGPSYLSGMLGRYTTMEVVSAENGMPLRENVVQVIPPGGYLSVSEGRLRLEKRPDANHLPHPIDQFFTALAHDAGSRAVAVVLSGFGTDGALGVQAVRDAGGIVLVQDPASALNPSMPDQAIATGAAHYILPPEEIPVRLAAIARQGCNLMPQQCLAITPEDEFAAILGALRRKTGHDFSSYKGNTVMRQIERRMAVNEVAGLNKYLALLESEPHEAQALEQELLIGVTSFFRDREAFRVIEECVIPQLFTGRSPDDPVRIWHACCASGEEVYSMAMLVREYLDRHGLGAKVQFFASDLDDVALAQARAGIYPDEAVAALGDRRVQAFFTRLDGRWHVNKALREMVVFAHHSLIKDAPFSRIDFLACRNFLIYLNSDMQKRLISLFHMVLKPGGVLFLGGSESPGRSCDLFAPLDKKWRIYRRLEGGRRLEGLFPFSLPLRRHARSGPAPQPAPAEASAPGPLAEKFLLERYAPPCVVVNEQYEVVYFSTRTGSYLEPPVGEPSQNLLKLAREELRPALRSAIYKAVTEKTPVAFRGVRLCGAPEAVNVMVEPLRERDAAGKLVLVILEPAQPAPVLPPEAEGTLPGDENAKDTLIRQLEEQLRVTHEQLQATTEQLETSHEGFMSTSEELISINEEFQAANEELQSTNEELETSKEELQALNEELSTLNAELQGKLEELNKLNADMENLLANSEIATLFLDRRLAIKRYSPAMAAIFDLVPADLGRTFRHLGGMIEWPDFNREAQKVLERLSHLEREVNHPEDGRCFLMRLLPYRGGEGSVDGVVVNLIDISERKRAEEEIRHRVEELRQSNEELERFNRASVNRELRMIELKREVNELCLRLAEPARYDLGTVDTEP